MFKPKATKQELQQLRVEQSRAFDEHNERLHTEFRQSVTSINAIIYDEVTKLRVENDALRTELTKLKADKQPLVVDNTSNLDETHDRLDVLQEGDCITFVRKDVLGDVISKTVMKSNDMTVTAEKITLNGADISGAQI